MTSADERSQDLSGFAGAWTLDPSRSSITFRTKAMWILPVTGTMNALEGSASVDDAGSVSATIVLDAASVNTKNRKRDTHLRTADFFDVETHPTMTFTATSARSTGAGKAEVDGDFTVVGRSRPMTVPVEYAASGTSVTVRGQVVLDRSDWGMTLTPMGAGLVNQVSLNLSFSKLV
jgi:polyisoprenoid-binding protein YceI